MAGSTIDNNAFRASLPAMSRGLAGMSVVQCSLFVGCHAADPANFDLVEHLEGGQCARILALSAEIKPACVAIYWRAMKSSRHVLLSARRMGSSLDTLGGGQDNGP
jgi:hypothetical protein